MHSAYGRFALKLIFFLENNLQNDYFISRQILQKSPQFDDS